MFSTCATAAKSWEASVQVTARAFVEVQCEPIEKLQKLLRKFMNQFLHIYPFLVDSQ